MNKYNDELIFSIEAREILNVWHPIEYMPTWQDIQVERKVSNTPDYIVRNETDELCDIVADKLNKQINKQVFAEYLLQNINELEDIEFIGNFRVEMFKNCLKIEVLFMTTKDLTDEDEYCEFRSEIESELGTYIDGLKLS